MNEHFSKLNSLIFSVTGRARFIDINRCETLLEIGPKVICLDILSTGKHEKLNEFKNNSMFSLFDSEVGNFDTCRIEPKT